MPELVHLPADAATDEIMAVLARDGALVLDGAISAEAADAVRAELQPFVDATPPGRDGFSGVKTTRTGALVARSPMVRDLILDGRIRALADALLLPNCDRYHLHLAQVIRIMPGQGVQPIHRDRWAWGPHLKGVEPQLNTIWALSDFTFENGATQVVPGSIEWPNSRQATPEEITWAQMKRGSVLVYTGTVFHGGGANSSDADRVGLNLTYSLGWLRQEENQYLSCPPEIARTLSPELQSLIGYAMGSYSLGYYTPPLPAGQGPEIVSPEYALTGKGGAGSTLGSERALAESAAKIRAG